MRSPSIIAAIGPLRRPFPDSFYSGINAMIDGRTHAGGLDQATKGASKLRAALDYLGDWLVTHPASRFKPSERPLLEEWRSDRRGRRKVASIHLLGGYRSWVTEKHLMRLTKATESKRQPACESEAPSCAWRSQRTRSIP